MHQTQVNHHTAVNAFESDPDRYYRSMNPTISTIDIQIGVDAVSALLPGTTSRESAVVSIGVDGTYWIGK